MFPGINSSLLRLEFLSGFLPSSLLSTKCYPWIDSRFFCAFLKPDYRLVFFENPPVKRLWIAWSKSLESFVKLMSKNSISEPFKEVQTIPGERGLPATAPPPPLPSAYQSLWTANIFVSLYQNYTILYWKPCSGSVTIWFVSGSCSCSFRQWPSRCQKNF
jgi:hypothetical protein